MPFAVLIPLAHLQRSNLRDAIAFAAYRESNGERIHESRRVPSHTAKLKAYVSSAHSHATARAAMHERNLFDLKAFAANIETFLYRSSVQHAKINQVHESKCVTTTARSDATPTGLLAKHC